MSTDAPKNDGSGKKKKRPEEDFPIQEYRLVPASQAYEGYDEDDEIDLIELAKTIWDNRKVIYRFVAVGAVLGVLVALFSPKEYVSDATLMPEYATEGDLGGASSLLQQYGGLIGLSSGTYNSASNAIRVDLYPKIVQSLTFQDKLAREDFYFSDYDSVATIYEYYLFIKKPGVFGYIQQFTIGLPGMVIGAIKGEDTLKIDALIDDDIVQLSEDEMEVIKELRTRVSASLDEESGVISVSAKMSDPVLAAKVAKYAIIELTQYLIEYRTEKVLRDLQFAEEQLSKAEERFETAQIALAEFRDQNQGSLTARAQTEEQRLQSEYDIAFNLYNGLTQQYEQAKLTVQEETPVFKVLQPIQVPVEDETSGVTVLILFVLSSFIAALLWVLFQHLVSINYFRDLF